MTKSDRMGFLNELLADMERREEEARAKRRSGGGAAARSSPPPSMAILPASEDLAVAASSLEACEVSNSPSLLPLEVSTELGDEAIPAATSLITYQATFEVGEPSIVVNAAPPPSATQEIVHPDLDVPRVSSPSDPLNAFLAQLHKVNNEYTTRTEIFGNAVLAMQAQIANLQNNCLQNHEHWATSQSAMGEIRTAMEVLRASLDVTSRASSSRESLFQQEIARLQGEITHFQGEVTRLQEHIIETEEKRAADAALITSLQTQLSNQQREIGRLEGTIQASSSYRPPSSIEDMRYTVQFWIDEGIVPASILSHESVRYVMGPPRTPR